MKHSKYEPKNHIVHVDIAPRSEGILDQREITIQSYQTTIPFDYAALNSGLEAAWLTPQIRLGVFARAAINDHDALNVVLGLQDELSVRAYDYDERRPLYYSWQNAIVDTVNIRYFRDDDGLLRFKTTGGGRRITDDRLEEFNAAFLSIPKDAVTKRHFDLEKLHELCFSRFIDRLYMLRFTDPSGEEYRSIDHALFQSRRYIDPQAERMREIQDDAEVTIESFDSDIEVQAAELAAPIHVRFFIRGLSGSLRLRFPKISYRKEPTSVAEQARIFYQLVDITENSILDADYYTHLPRSLDELDVKLGVFPDMVELAPYREVLTSESARAEFIERLDPGAPWQEWQPHLRALDELLVADAVGDHVKELVTTATKADPQRIARLLTATLDDSKVKRVGALMARAVAAELQTVPAEHRAQAEEAVLSWAVACEEDGWQVDADSGEISVFGLHWTLDDLFLDVIPCVVWKVVGVLHSRLRECKEGAGPLLEKYAWCMAQAKALSPHHSNMPRAFRLVAADRVPQTIRDAATVLKDPVVALADLDQAVLEQYGLPLWPKLTASRQSGQVEVFNAGVGAALGVTLRPAGVLFGDEDEPVAADVLSGTSTAFPIASSVRAVEAEFEKYGRRRRVTLEVADDTASIDADRKARTAQIPTAISRKRRAAQREYRKSIDPKGIVIGSSSAMMEVFENIHYANAMNGCEAVLILGEPGVGKTHIAQLLHDSSTRATKPFEVVNAGGGGGDINIQRGEWIGYGKGHGIQGVDSKGSPGHLMTVDGGTLFVDEFATMSQDLQVIFLSVLEGRSIDKIGGEAVTPNVRCVFATNADIDEAVTSGSLRRDLVDRIGITFRIPPLRERRGDILILTRHFASEHGITDRCLAAMLRYDWRSNVRELQKLISRAAARKSSEGAAIDLDHVDLPAEIIEAVEQIDDEACRRELWCLADEIARDEGYAPGTGLQKRAGEIMGVGEAQASKMYKAHGLVSAVSA
jgi:sigma-54 specific flagellar transcriptional regulator A